MGQKVSDSTVIDATAETIFEIIIDIPSYPEWTDGVETAEVLEHDDDGRPLKARYKVDARVVEVGYTLGYRYDGHDVYWELVEGETVNQLDGSYILEPEGDRTKVTYTIEADVNIPLPGFMKKRAAKQILDTGLRGLKKRAEGT